MVGGGRVGVTGGGTTPLCRTAWRPGGAQSLGASAHPSTLGSEKQRPARVPLGFALRGVGTRDPSRKTRAAETAGQPGLGDPASPAPWNPGGGCALPEAETWRARAPSAAPLRSAFGFRGSPAARGTQGKVGRGFPCSRTSPLLSSKVSSLGLR